MIISLVLSFFTSKIGSRVLLIGAAVITVIGLFLNIRNSGRIMERAEIFKKNAEVQHEQLRIAANRPRSRTDLVSELRAGRF